jgi:hypothetical protein
MLDRVRRQWGTSDSVFAGRVTTAGGWVLDQEKLLFALRKSLGANRPVLLAGTAFSFVHLLDYLAANKLCYQFAAGSRVMETGGYKGRSRSLPREELHGLLQTHLGIPREFIVCEYGMCELSSQAYDWQIPDPASGAAPARFPRLFRFPPWARVKFICPEKGAEAAAGQPGLARIYDLANAWSVLAVQTEDLGVWRGDGFELMGRAAAAETRGCSLLPESR